MSSSNEVDIIYVEEAVYDETPAATPFDTVRKTDETLSGTPDTVIGDEARKDRQSNGQAIVGLQVGGGIPYQLSRSKCFDDFLAAALYNDWTAEAPEAAIAVDIVVTDGVGTMTRSVGDFTTTFSQGTFASIANADDPENAVVILITGVTALVINFIGPATMVSTAATDTLDLTQLSYAEIGTTRKSYSMEKQFTDIGKFIAYTGMRLSKVSVNASLKAIVSGAFEFMGASISTPTISIADGETVNPAGTAPYINPQVDMGVIAVDDAVAQYTIKSVTMEIDNNVSPEEGVGKIGAADQIPFEGMVSLTMEAHLNAVNFALIGVKLSQVPISLAFYLRDPNGNGYAFYIPEMQVSFPDPNMGGKNNHVMLNMTGAAKFSTLINNTIRIARIGVVS